MIDALQMTELLLTKVPDTYQYYFRREGVMYEIEKMANEPLLVVSSSKSKSKAAASSATDAGTSTPGTPATPNLPGASTPADDGGDTADLGTRTATAVPATSAAVPKALTSTESLQKDAITLRAKHLRKMLGESSKAGGSVKADSALNEIRVLVDALDAVSVEKTANAAQGKAQTALETIAGLFASSKDPMSSFEMQESGLIEGLLRFATDGKETVREFGIAGGPNAFAGQSDPVSLSQSTTTSVASCSSRRSCLRPRPPSRHLLRSSSDSKRPSVEPKSSMSSRLCRRAVIPEAIQPRCLGVSSGCASLPPPTLASRARSQMWLSLYTPLPLSHLSTTTSAPGSRLRLPQRSAPRVDREPRPRV